MSNKNTNKEIPTVFASDNGTHMIMLPSGDVIDYITYMTIESGTETHAVVSVTFPVNIAKDESDAKKIYLEDKCDNSWGYE